MPLLTYRYFRGTQRGSLSCGSNLGERLPSSRCLAGYLYFADHLCSASFPSSLLLCAVKVFASLFYGFLAQHAFYSVKQRTPALASLKSSSCLSKFTQTCREKQANRSDLTHFSGKTFRHGEKIRLPERVSWSCPEKWCKQAFQVFKRSAVIS